MAKQRVDVDHVPPELRGDVNVRAFGACGDGVTDDTGAIRAAIAAANGRTVYFPPGIYKITRSITQGVVTNQIRLRGSGFAKFSHGILNFAFNNIHDYSPRSLSLKMVRSGYSVIDAVGTPIVGGDDGPSNETEHRLKYFGDLLCYGDKSTIALNISPQDCLVENSGFALFGRYGILIRGGITSRFSNLSFQDCGWALDGAMKGNNVGTYSSGCAIKVVANNIAGDYRTILPPYRPTTMMFDSIFVNVRKETGLNQSGMRAFQCAGGIGFNLQNMQAYSGVIMSKTQASISGLYVENYDFNGFRAGDRLPVCFAAIGCAISSSEPYLANMEVRHSHVEVVVPGDRPSAYNSVSESDGSGFRTDGVLRAGRSETITATAGGGTRVYTLLPWALRNRGTFTGLVYVSLVSRDNPALYATAEYAVHRHVQNAHEFVAPAVCIARFASPGCGCEVLGAEVNASGGVSISVRWAAKHLMLWDADVGLIGAGSP